MGKRDLLRSFMIRVIGEFSLEVEDAEVEMVLGLGGDLCVADGVYRWRMVTLNVHSSLLAVGFIAAISAKFRDNGEF